ncbi:MAG: zf-TFIIB domain-containing protein [Patescibacteria group bacterium]|nr:zf-TFIIB domain-containing protein [Patescibacteria group bacterium]
MTSLACSVFTPVVSLFFLGFSCLLLIFIAALINTGLMEISQLKAKVQEKLEFITCRHCDNKVTTKDRICFWCRQPLNDTCPRCGTSLLTEERQKQYSKGNIVRIKYCPQCGVDIGKYPN